MICHSGTSTVWYIATRLQYCLVMKAIGILSLFENEWSNGHIENSITLGFAKEGWFKRFESRTPIWCTAEVLRLEAERCLKKGEATAAEDLLHRALAVAEKQEALAWTLRCCLSLARLRCGQSRYEEAQDMMQAVFVAVRPGFVELRFARR